MQCLLEHHRRQGTPKHGQKLVRHVLVPGLRHGHAYIDKSRSPDQSAGDAPRVLFSGPSDVTNDGSDEEGLGKGEPGEEQSRKDASQELPSKSPEGAFQQGMAAFLLVY